MRAGPGALGGPGSWPGGPPEWDLACLTASSRVLGSGAAAAAALAGYGVPHDAERLDLLIEGRTLQGIAWAFAVLPDAAAHPRLLARLAWLETRR